MQTLEATTSPRLRDLHDRRRELLEKIARETRRLRDQSRVRAAIRTRVVGETLIKMQEQGLLTEEFEREFKRELRSHVEGKAREFEALQGSRFDVTQLLREPSERAVEAQ
jgi:hypothetical protein